MCRESVLSREQHLKEFMSMQGANSMLTKGIHDSIEWLGAPDDCSCRSFYFLLNITEIKNIKNGGMLWI
jgi:hypothetical protein